jgi:hypothetical protein
VDKAADAGQQHMEGAVAELAAIPALQDAVPLQAAGPQCCRRGPVSRRSSLQRYRTVTRKGTQNKSSVVDAYCDSFYFQQFVAEQLLGGILAALKPGCCPDKQESDSG